MVDKEKKFDCVEMKKKGSAFIYNKVKNLSLKEELAFWKEKELEMRKKISGEKTKKISKTIKKKKAA